MFRKDQLDIPFNEINPEEEESTETPRLFIRNSEQEFGIAPRDLTILSDEELTTYIDFLDELWDK